MNLLVFGASGATGREVVRQALARGHSVTVFLRQTARLPLQHASVRTLEGDVGDASAVRQAVAHHDAVISTLGVSAPLKPDPVVVDGVRHIVSAMEATGVTRLIYQSFIGVRDSRAAVGFVLRYVAPLPLRHEIADHEAKEAIVSASSLDWTIVRPPKLTDGPATGSFRVGEGITTWHPLPVLSRATVASFIITELEQPAYVRKVVRLLP